MNTEQRATLPTNHARNGKNLTPEKELIGAMSLIGVTAKTAAAPRELAAVRFYMARRSDGASPVYCSVWLHHSVHDTAGHGRATGYGYHKRSAALQAALDSAGVKLAQAIDGRGDSAMRDALLAIGRAMGYDAARLAVIEHG